MKETITEQNALEKLESALGTLLAGSSRKQEADNQITNNHKDSHMIALTHLYFLIRTDQTNLNTEYKRIEKIKENNKVGEFSKKFNLVFSLNLIDALMKFSVKFSAEFRKKLEEENLLLLKKTLAKFFINRCKKELKLDLTNQEQLLKSVDHFSNLFPDSGEKEKKEEEIRSSLTIISSALGEINKDSNINIKEVSLFVEKHTLPNKIHTLPKKIMEMIKKHNFTLCQLGETTYGGKSIVIMDDQQKEITKTVSTGAAKVYSACEEFIVSIDKQDQTSLTNLKETIRKELKDKKASKKDGDFSFWKCLLHSSARRDQGTAVLYTQILELINPPENQEKKITHNNHALSPT